MSLRFAPLLALATTAGMSSAQTTYYVDDDGAAPGTGTLGDPFPTIQAALDHPALAAGDRISVAPGTYVENVDYPYRDPGIRVASSSGPDVTTIVGSVFLQGPFFQNRAELEGFTILSTHPVAGVELYAGLVKHSLVRNGGATTTGVHVTEIGSIENSVITGFEVGLEEEDLGLGAVVFTLTDSILWNNDVDIVEVPYSGIVSSIRRSAFAGGPFQDIVVTDPISGDPLLWLPDEGDVRLRPGSPCIDAGDPTAPLDADGSVADVGLFPFDPSYAPAPNVYCTTKVSSDGCTPVIGTVGGSASFAADEPFLVTADGVPEFKNGLFFYGLGATPFPYQGGWFCIQPPTVRTFVQSSGSAGTACSGSYGFDFANYLAGGAPPFVQPGDLIYGQYWLRDPADAFGSLRTDAVRFAVLP